MRSSPAGACGAARAFAPATRPLVPALRSPLNNFLMSTLLCRDFGDGVNVLLADHRSLDIRDGGNDPCDDDRR